MTPPPAPPALLPPAALPPRPPGPLPPPPPRPAAPDPPCAPPAPPALPPPDPPELAPPVELPPVPTPPEPLPPLALAPPELLLPPEPVVPPELLLPPELVVPPVPVLPPVPLLPPVLLLPPDPLFPPVPPPFPLLPQPASCPITRKAPNDVMASGRKVFVDMVHSWIRIYRGARVLADAQIGESAFPSIASTLFSTARSAMAPPWRRGSGRPRQRVNGMRVRGGSDALARGTHRALLQHSRRSGGLPNASRRRRGDDFEPGTAGLLMWLRCGFLE